MVIAGDFNLDLASAARELHTTERLLGGRMKEGNGSENAKLLINFCTGNKMLRHQTAQSVIKKLLKYKKNLTRKIKACILRNKKSSPKQIVQESFR